MRFAILADLMHLDRAATRELRESDRKACSAGVAHAIGAVKSNPVGPRLQDEFFRGARQPILTRQ